MIEENTLYWFKLTRNLEPIEVSDSLHIYSETYKVENDKVTLYWAIDGSDSIYPDKVMIESWQEPVPKKRTFIKNLTEFVGEKVLVKGWVSQWRELKKMSFLILRDSTGYSQVVVSKDLCKSLSPESVVEIVGTVKTANQSTDYEVEIMAEKFTILSEAEVLPFPIYREEDIPPFNTLNQYRPLTLRKEKERCIFKIQSVILQEFRYFLSARNFTEINSTKISAAGLEGGSDMFKVDYYGEAMFLTQSPQFYKQMMVGVFERVFEVGKVYRAEGSNTNRHLAEFIGLDVEMGFINSVQDIMDLEESLLHYIFIQVFNTCQKELKYLNIDLNSPIKTVKQAIPRISYNQLFSILEEENELRLHSQLNLIGINSEIEKWLGDYVKTKFNSDFVFIYGYPIDEKPFYTMPSNETILNDGYNFLSESFDLLYKGVEITSGGQRIHNYQQLVDSIESKHLDPTNFESYLMPFKYGMPPHGGFGLGLERLLKQMLNLQSADEASLIVRTKDKFIH